MTYVSTSSNRNYDTADLIVQLQKTQNKVQLDSTVPLTIYRYVQWSSRLTLGDIVTVTIDSRARYDQARYDVDVYE